MLRNIAFFVLFCAILNQNAIAQKLSLKINGSEYPLIYNKAIEIDAKQKTLNVILNASKDYSIKLDKYDVNWLSCSENTSLNYSNISGGEYILLIKSNISRKEISRIKLIVEMPFWRKWSFIIFVYFAGFGIVSLIIYFFFLYRFRQQTKLQKVRNDIASDLHDDVGATLSSISFFGEMMRSKVLKNAPAEEILPLLDKVISTSKETIETMRGVVWTINPNNDNAIDFFQKLRTFGNEMLATKNINFQFETSGFEDQKLPLDVQRNLFLFYKECINNIAKHSKATDVGCEISVFENRNVSFTIKDNGLGFDPNDLHEGHGLKSLRKRSDELDGKLEITSAEGKGTNTKLEFPLP
jgi:hypothetical protein